MSFTECNGTHAAAAVCWLCSDARPWWREARIKAGLSADPPNAHPNVAVVFEEELPASNYAGIRYGENIYAAPPTSVVPVARPLALWEELTADELRLLGYIDASQPIDMWPRYRTAAAALQRRGLAGIDHEDKYRWKLGIKGTAVLADWLQAQKVSA